MTLRGVKKTLTLKFCFPVFVLNLLRIFNDAVHICC